jgi:hypothetical protein
VNVRDLVVGIRGGVPERCDFCQQPTPPDDLHPEEGEEWACITCLERWNRNELARLFADAQALFASVMKSEEEVVAKFRSLRVELEAAIDDLRRSVPWHRRLWNRVRGKGILD